MRMHSMLSCATVALLLLAACSSSERSTSSDDDDGGGGAQTGTGSGGNGGVGGSSTSSGGGAGSGGAGGAAATLPSCYPTCATAADCVVPNGGPLHDIDNYECNGGRCEWLGCNTTNECTTTFMDPDYICSAPPGSTLDYCYPSCATAADCVLPNGGTLYDIDNYACNSGRCDWLGCNSTSECTAAFMNPDYVCGTMPGTTFDSCYPSCATAADCVVPNGGPLYDADNYECNSGLCQWIGCNSTAECTDTFMNPDYVCDE
jgi:hypothetical protein